MASMMEEHPRCSTSTIDFYFFNNKKGKAYVFPFFIEIPSGNPAEDLNAQK
jgi:hypothetical protein